jgi:hypothetical protein
MTTEVADRVLDPSQVQALSEGLIAFLEQNTEPEGLFQPDIFCDISLPQWRLQTGSGDELVAYGARATLIWAASAAGAGTHCATASSSSSKNAGPMPTVKNGTHARSSVRASATVASAKCRSTARVTGTGRAWRSTQKRSLFFVRK